MVEIVCSELLCLDFIVVKLVMHEYKVNYVFAAHIEVILPGLTPFLPKLGFIWGLCDRTDKILERSPGRFYRFLIYVRTSH